MVSFNIKSPAGILVIAFGVVLALAIAAVIGKASTGAVSSSDGSTAVAAVDTSSVSVFDEDGTAHMTGIDLMRTYAANQIAFRQDFSGKNVAIVDTVASVGENPDKTGKYGLGQVNILLSSGFTCSVNDPEVENYSTLEPGQKLLMHGVLKYMDGVTPFIGDCTLLLCSDTLNPPDIANCNKE